MNVTKNKMIVVVLSLVIIAAVSYFVILPMFQPKQSIKVGLLLSWTGAGAPTAAENEKGIKLWLDKVNAAGGLLGRNVELVLGDDESDPAKGRIAFERLVLEDNVNVVIGPIYSSVGMAISPLANKYKVPVLPTSFTTMTANNIFANGTYVWRPCGNNKAIATAIVGTLNDCMIPTLVKEKGLNENNIKVQIIRGDDEGARDIDQWMHTFWQAKGVNFQILNTMVMSFTATDFTPEIRLLQDRKPDIVIPLSWGATSAVFCKQCRDLGSKFIITGFGDVSTSPIFWDATGKTRAGVVATSYYPIWTDLTQITKSFDTAYQQKYKATPSPAAAMAYDCCLVFENAVTKAGSADRQAVANAMASLDFIGVKREIKFVTNPTASDSHDVVDAWHTMSQYQPSPSIIGGGSPLYNTTANGLRMVLIWPLNLAEGKFYIPDYYVPSSEQ